MENISGHPLSENKLSVLIEALAQISWHLFSFLLLLKIIERFKPE